MITKKNELSDDINDKVDRMYSSFVSVLGIFVTISFSLFGAVSLLNHLFNISNNILNSNKSETGIGNAIMLSGFAMILIYLLLVGLMNGIAHIIDRDFKFNKVISWIVGITSVALIIVGFFYPIIYQSFYGK